MRGKPHDQGSCYLKGYVCGTCDRYGRPKEQSGTHIATGCTYYPGPEELVKTLEALKQNPTKEKVMLNKIESTEEEELEIEEEQ